MVGMEVGQQDVNTGAFSQRGAETPDAGSRVKDDDFVVLAAHLDAGRIAAVAYRLRSGAGERTPGAPQNEPR